jgi:lysozyme family protein
MFTHALQVVLSVEGGYVNNVRDPGGETNMGISHRAFPRLDIKNLTLDTVSQIYRTKYWNACRCDDLPDGLDLMVFDCAVNQGETGTAQKLLQKVLGVKQDGKFGAKTIAAVKERPVASLINHMAIERLYRYMVNPNWITFKDDWMLRLFIVHQNCFI